VSRGELGVEAGHGHFCVGRWRQFLRRGKVEVKEQSGRIGLHVVPSALVILHTVVKEIESLQ
jgi:hypothetical protein